MIKMILAEKITELRKKNGWSQEELANQMNVSRQSVSKWESAQSIPDLDKIIQMSRIFGVSTDFLLKDDMETVEYSNEEPEPESSSVRRVSLEEANEFLHVKQQTARPVGFAVALCILSPVTLLLLAGACEAGLLTWTEEAACGIGLIVLFLMVAVAVALFILTGMRTKPFEYLEHENIETEYGVSGMVREKKKQYRETYVRSMVVGTSLCILAAIPLFAGCMFTEDECGITVCVSGTLLLVSVGVYFFITGGTYWASMEKLLQEGEYTVEKKREKGYTGRITSIYWLLATALYLGLSFAMDDWTRTWIIWPVAGVLFAAVREIAGGLGSRH